MKKNLHQSKGLKKDFQLNRLKKKSGVAILVSNKTDFQPKLIKRDRSTYYIFMKEKSTKMMSLI